MSSSKELLKRKLMSVFLYFHFSQSVEMKPADNKATLKLGVSLSANLTVSG